MKKEMDLQNLLSPESCRSSTVDHVEEMSLEHPRRRQDIQEVMDETATRKATKEHPLCFHPSALLTFATWNVSFSAVLHLMST